jgi:hypothetical protein
MNKRIGKIWIEALRSGEFSQVEEVLKSSHGHCCLGVLCELYTKETEQQVFNKLDDGQYSRIDNSDDEDLPDFVRDWAGMKSNHGVLPEIHPFNSLAEMNDDGIDFNEIANVIEEQMDVL